MIYGTVYANAELNLLPIEARHMYIGMLVLADDDGRLRADPRYLKGQFFSYDEKITSTEVEKWLEMLEEIGQVSIYERDGVKILRHPKWKKYQAIRADMYVTSKLPSPLRNRNEDDTETVHKLSKDKLSKDKEREENTELVAHAPTPKESASNFFQIIQEKSSDFEVLVQSISTTSRASPDIVTRELLKFASYWTEPTPTGNKQRWEKEKTFEVKRRLVTWFGNVKQFSGSKQITNKYKPAII